MIFIEAVESIRFHSIRIRLDPESTEKVELSGEIDQPDALSQWYMRVWFDDDLKGEIFSLPPLGRGPERKDLQIHIQHWNNANILPRKVSRSSLDIWKVTTTIRNVRMPKKGKNWCRFGQSFRGGHSVAAIIAYDVQLLQVNSETNVTLKAPEQGWLRVWQPCVPCLEEWPCEYWICDPSCRSNPILKTLVLQNVSLQADQVYSLRVKATLSTGKSVQSQSPNIIIDTTAPVFDSSLPLFYMDPESPVYQAAPINITGSNSTIKVLWIVSDKESSVVECFWAIGSRPGKTDIQSWKSVGDSRVATNDRLVLQHGRKYFVSVRVVNGAGLSATYQDRQGVSVFLHKINKVPVMGGGLGVSKITQSSLTTQVMQQPSDEEIAAFYVIQTDPEIATYEFCVGSNIWKSFSEDVVKCIPTPSTKGIHKISLKKGEILWDGRANGTFKLARNPFSETSTKTQSLRLEPGRLLILYVRACNLGNRCLTKAFAEQIVNASKYSTFVLGRQMLTSSSDFHLDGVLRNQYYLLAKLSLNDVVEEFQSDASDEFNPFIVNPLLTHMQTSRFMKERILSDLVDYFALSPIGRWNVTKPLQISVPVSDKLLKLHKEIGTEKASIRLLSWNKVNKEWMLTNESCPMSVGKNPCACDSPEAGRICQCLCNTHKSNMKRDREDKMESDYFSESTMFALAIVKDTLLLRSPKIAVNKNSRLMLETGQQNFIVIPLTADDVDGDSLDWSLPVQAYGSCRSDQVCTTNSSIAGEVHLDRNSSLLTYTVKSSARLIACKLVDRIQLNLVKTVNMQPLKLVHYPVNIDMSIQHTPVWVTMDVICISDTSKAGSVQKWNSDEHARIKLTKKQSRPGAGNSTISFEVIVRSISCSSRGSNNSLTLNVEKSSRTEGLLRWSHNTVSSRRGTNGTTISEVKYAIVYTSSSSGSFFVDLIAQSGSAMSNHLEIELETIRF